VQSVKAGLTHSRFSARIGSIRAARRAGGHAAIKTTAISSETAAAIIAGPIIAAWDCMAGSPRNLIRRIVVVVVPPVDELDLVGPLLVFNSINRLTGRPITRSRLSPAAST